MDTALEIALGPEVAGLVGEPLEDPIEIDVTAADVSVDGRLSDGVIVTTTPGTLDTLGGSAVTDTTTKVLFGKIDGVTTLSKQCQTLACKKERCRWLLTLSPQEQARP